MSNALRKMRRARGFRPERRNIKRTRYTKTWENGRIVKVMSSDRPCLPNSEKALAGRAKSADRFNANKTGISKASSRWGVEK